ncbi:Phosphogluconate dehydrogenase (NADP(+)-dependent, decarboxylating) [Saliniradius amylolyticus]|uniref:6-phosphogluconate dehydrogenase, decarboxylating n=1 Tax=Saliniradius amylolyticus TaxID=2183582 RepID=A0A2S2E3I6_9ALTE|nr:NADP-dependent phosphogluconate dehydrogenase [Saliniradius amylolyticus]AWL12159.1 Phosphogluconate dehydrogenase (NADP(+)-dependent, decarboxylating) [Saliniradius amylolyticus]
MTRDSQRCDIGFIGLGVMGKNLTLNLADHGYRIACFDLDQSKVDAIQEQDAKERGDAPPRVVGCRSYTELLGKLEAPHLIILSVPAGEPVDHVCNHLIDAGIGADDIVVDTGNSLWTDSVEREQRYKGKFIFFSTAVSGGEVGARFGASLMPSGDPYAWTRIEPVLHAIAAKVDPKTGKPLESFEPGKPVTEGEPCATYIGPVGAGHYVKMVHNGIEYADMQLICEAYHVMRSGLGMTPVEVARIFRQWDKGVLNSYLMGISAEVLEKVDDETGQPLVDVIMDKAGQKGTGLWTAVSALQVGSPAQTIAQAVFARSISSLKDERVRAKAMLPGMETPKVDDKQRDKAIQALHDALYCSKICVYAQGFQLMELASQEHGWELDFAEIAKIWRAGCIIRAVFLQSITQAYEQNDELANLLLDPFFASQIQEFQGNWRRAVADATLMGIPCSAMSSALNYYDSYRCDVLPASLLQGQRDYFGAHTFERVDKPEGRKFHIEWSQPGQPQVAIKR